MACRCGCSPDFITCYMLMPSLLQGRNQRPRIAQPDLRLLSLHLAVFRHHSVIGASYLSLRNPVPAHVVSTSKTTSGRNLKRSPSPRWSSRFLECVYTTTQCIR